MGRQPSRFQPTPPARTETITCVSTFISSLFQPTPPARTETLNGPMFRESPFYFNPLRPRGRRLAMTSDNLIGGMYFNPLRPRGRRPPGLATMIIWSKISTHSAREDGDRPDSGLDSSLCDFNPLRPRGRRRHKFVRVKLPIGFQPTPPARTETNLYGHTIMYDAISTHSAREDGDIVLYDVVTYGIDFNPLRPRGRRLLLIYYPSIYKNFNPLRPRGRRR